MATAYNSNGYRLAIQSGSSPASYKRIAAVMDVPPIGWETTIHRTDTHDEEGWGSSITGLRNQRPIEITVRLDPDDVTHDFTTTATGLGYLAEQTPPVLKNFLAHPKDQEDKALFFSAYVGSIGMPAPVDGVLTMTVTLVPTGAPAHGDATGLIV